MARYEHLFIAGSGAANAAYFAARAWRSAGARRLAAAVLLLTFAGLALDASTHFASHLAAAPDASATAPLQAALLRLPALAGSLAASALIALGVGR